LPRIFLPVSKEDVIASDIIPAIFDGGSYSVGEVCHIKSITEYAFAKSIETGYSKQCRSHRLFFADSLVPTELRAELVGPLSGTRIRIDYVGGDWGSRPGIICIRVISCFNLLVDDFSEKN